MHLKRATSIDTAQGNALLDVAMAGGRHGNT